MQTRVVAVALLATILVACGGGGDDDSGSTIEPGTQENVLAHSMTLGIEDFGDGWRHDNFTKEFEEDPFDECETSDDGVTGRAETGDFSYELQGAMSEHVFVFETASEAAANLREMDEREDCVVEVLDAGGADNTRVTFSDPVREESETLDFGEGTASFRVSARATPRSTGSLSGVGTIYADFLYVVVGRVGIAVLGSDDFDPISSSLFEDFTQMAVEKAADALDAEVADPRGERADETPEPTEDETVAPTLEATRVQVTPVGDAIPLGSEGEIEGRMRTHVVDVNFDAEAAVLAENQFNEPAEPGMRMVMVTLGVTNIGVEPLDLYYDLDYKIVGDDGELYDSFNPSCGVIQNGFDVVLAEGSSVGELAAGGSVEGNVCVAAGEDGTGLVLILKLYGSGSFDDEEIYLALE